MSKGRVTAPGLNMRLAPGKDTEIVHVLAEHDEVTIIKSETHGKTWLFVWYCKDDFAKYGWVSSEFVELIAPRPSPYMPPAQHPKEPLPECDELPIGVWIAGTVVVLAIVALVVGALLK